jgi:hypothetical protein
VKIELHEPVYASTNIEPYCGRCRVAWPCPKASAEAGTLHDLPVTVPAPGMEIVPVGVIPNTHCRECGARWPCPMAARRGGHPNNTGNGKHKPLTSEN